MQCAAATSRCGAIGDSKLTIGTNGQAGVQQESGSCWARSAAAEALDESIHLLDWSYIGYHLLVNLLTVDAVNYTLELTLCPDVLLACCDPLNVAVISLPAGLGPCGWLVGHTLAYFHAAFAWAGRGWRRHATLLACQLLWFFFEMLTFAHVLAWERLVFYDGAAGTHNVTTTTPSLFHADAGHPCASRPYFSTWIPIWQDFPYNCLGQLLGWAAAHWVARERRERRLL